MNHAHKMVCIAVCSIVLLLTADGFLTSAGSESLVTAVRFDSTGQSLALGRDDGSVSLWSRRDKRILWSSPSMKGSPIFGLFFRHTDQELIAVDHHGDIRIHDTSHGTRIGEISFPPTDLLGKEENPIQAAALDPTGNFLAVSDRLFSFFKIVDLKLALGGGSFGKAVLREHYFQETPGYEGLTDLRFCSAGKYIAGTTKSGFLGVWRNEGAKEETVKEAAGLQDFPYLRKVGDGHAMFRALLGLDCSETGSLLTVGYFSKYGQMQLWNIEAGEMTDHVKEEVDPILLRRIVVEKGGRFAVALGELRYALWKITGEKLHPLGKIHLRGFRSIFHFPYAVDFSPGGDHLALGLDAYVFLMSTSNLNILETVGTPPHPPLITSF